MTCVVKLVMIDESTGNTILHFKQEENGESINCSNTTGGKGVRLRRFVT